MEKAWGVLPEKMCTLQEENQRAVAVFPDEPHKT